MPRFLLTSCALAFLLVGLTGCDAVDDIFGDGNEVTGLVESVDADGLTVDATRYTVTDATEFEGYTSLADVSVGDEAGIEYEDRSGERFAIEVEDSSAPDPD